MASLSVSRPPTTTSAVVVAFFQLLFVCALISFTNGFNPRISIDAVEERECAGTANGFSCPGTPVFRYQQLRKRYLGCTHVLGNLEITHLDEPTINYDLSFLRHIQYVSGYVLIGLIGEVTKIPLTKLEIIRGNQTFKFQDEEYSMMVALTSRETNHHAEAPVNGLKTLMMPKLKEISNGKVMFIQNPCLGHIDTVDWEPIVKGRLDAVNFGQEPYNQSESNGTDPDLCNGGGMWGNDWSLCQEVISLADCDKSCDGLCFGPSAEECCADTCAIGCTGPKRMDCMYCKDFEYEDECVGYCPALSYPLMQQCIKYSPLN